MASMLVVILFFSCLLLENQEMGDTSGCQINSNNLAVYLQGVTVTPSSNITSEYFVTGSLPSSASTHRVWQFTTQGTLTGPLTATLTLDYTVAHENCPNYNITFDGRLNGTFIVHNQVFSANKFISYQLTSTYVLVLTLRIPTSILECFGDKPQHYSFSVYVNDLTETSSTYILGNFQQSELNTTQVLQGTTSSGELCNWSNGQSYYYGGYGISSSINTYTGYLTLSPAVFSENSCSGPTTFVIDISSGFPTYSSTSNSYIVLGLQFDVGLSTADPLTLTVSANNTSTSNKLYFGYFASTGKYGVQLILVYSSSNTLDSYVLSPSNDGNFFITVSPSSTVTYPILDASGYVMYETTASTVTLFATLGTSAIYISFATTPVSGYSLQLNNFSTSSTIYLNNPSTGSYQQVSITNTTSTTFYYCVATWQTYSCAVLSFSYTTNNSLTSTVIEGSNDCTWSESQTYSYPGSYCNDASGNPVYTGYLQFAVNSSSCTAPTNLVLSISDFPTTTTGTVLLGLEFDSTTSYNTNPSTIVIDYGATTMSTISLPSSIPDEIPIYGYILLYNASTGWQVQNYATALTSVLYVISSFSYSSSVEIFILDTSGNTLYLYDGGNFTLFFQNYPTVYVSFISSPSQNEIFAGYYTYPYTSIYFATTVQQYQLIENFEDAAYYYYCNTSWGTDSC